MATLIPEYLNIDFNTLTNRLKALLKEDATFADTDYEGSNISLLIELLAYIAELNTYYINKVAKNVYLDTADQYETVHSLSSQIGYYPKGYRSARVVVTVALNSDASLNNLTPVNIGDTIHINAWSQVSSSISSPKGNEIMFTNPESYTGTVTSSGFSFPIYMIQGEVVRYTTYRGSDIIDNELLLPTFNFAYDDILDDDYQTMQLFVNNILWSRVSDFYDEISGLTTVENVYMMVYDKFGRSKILFNSARNVPINNDELEIVMIKSLGEDGNSAIATITVPSTNFLYNQTNQEYISSSAYTITNEFTTRSAADPETIEELKENAKGGLHSQYRNVTSVDYIAFLESRSDVIVANVWGENEISPSGSILEYNKVHVCVIPDEWGTSTINYTTTVWTPDGSSETDDEIIVPTTYSTSYNNNLKEYLEPRKILTTYEIMDVPELVYFAINIGVRLKRLYNLTDVAKDVLDKLDQYFRKENREFGDVINPMDLEEYILDTTIISETDTTNEFTYIKGIRNLVIRDIDCNKTIYAYNTDNNYPYFTKSSYANDVENNLRPIQLGYNQFPMLSLYDSNGDSIGTTTVTEE